MLVPRASNPRPSSANVQHLHRSTPICPMSSNAEPITASAGRYLDALSGPSSLTTSRVDTEYAAYRVRLDKQPTADRGEQGELAADATAS